MSENSAVPNVGTNAVTKEVTNAVPKEVCKRLCEWLGLDTRSPITLWNSGNRTFTTGNDMLALKERLVAEGMWEKFYWFIRILYTVEVDAIGGLCSEHDNVDWLLNPVRFALLVDEFLRREK